ncbi:hypothetical protein PFISCL1PPCAC_2334, partial [Pristionchus fissidentatus]
SSAASTSNLVEVGETRVLRRPIYKYVKYLRTLIGIIAVFVVFSAGISELISITHIPLGIYLIVIACPVFLLEIGFLLKTFCGTDGICCRAFSLVLSFDKIKRGLLYMVFSILCFLDLLGPDVYTRVAGGFLVVTGVFYLIKDREYKTVKTYLNDVNVQPARQQTT